MRAGLFGELIHLQGGYQHDLRGVKFNSGDPAQPYDSGASRVDQGISKQGNRRVRALLIALASPLAAMLYRDPRVGDLMLILALLTRSTA